MQILGGDENKEVNGKGQNLRFFSMEICALNRLNSQITVLTFMSQMLENSPTGSFNSKPFPWVISSNPHCREGAEGGGREEKEGPRLHHNCRRGERP